MPTWPKKGVGEPFGPFGHPHLRAGAYMTKTPPFGPDGQMRETIPYKAAPSAPYGQKSDGHPDGQRAFGHPLPSAYGRGWLPLAIGGQCGEAGERY